MYNYLFKFCLLCSSYANPEADIDGWVSISPIMKTTYLDSGAAQDDHVEWTIFTKELGSQMLKVRIPGDPEYQYISADELQITANSNLGLFQVEVLHAIPQDKVETLVKEILLEPDILLGEVSRIDENRWDIHYKKEQKWVAKTFLLKENHLSIFSSENTISHRQNHQDFVSSLEIKIPQK